MDHSYFQVSGCNVVENNVALFGSDGDITTMRVFINDDREKAFFIGVTDPADPKFFVSPTPNPGDAKLTIRSSDGFVGIGHTDPQYELDVDGSMFVSGSIIGYSAGGGGGGGGSSQWITGSGSNIYYNTANVGIGSARPSQRLDVSGGIAVGGHIIPKSNIAYDIGTSNRRFRDLYLSGNTINLGGLLLSRSEDGTSVNITQSATTNVNGSLNSSIATALNTSLFADVLSGSNIALGAANLNTVKKSTPAVLNLVGYTCNVITGTVNFTSNVPRSSNVVTSYIASYNSNVTISSNVSYASNITYTSNVSYDSNVTYTSNVSGSNVQFSSNAQFTSNMTSSSNIQLTSNVSISSNMVFTSNATSNTAVLVNSNVTFTSNLYNYIPVPLVRIDTRSNANALFIGANGEIGIGTTTVTSNKLVDINGSVRIRGELDAVLAASNIVGGGVISSNLLPSTGVLPGTYGSSNFIPRITIDATGRATEIVAVPLPSIDSLDASNITSGILNAARLPSSGITAGTYGQSNAIPRITFDATGRAISVVLEPINDVSVNALDASNIVSGYLNTARLPLSGVTAGTYGASNTFPRITFDATGRATAVTLVDVGIPPTFIDASNIVSGVLNSNLFPVSGVPAGTYGTSNVIPRITFDAAGRAIAVDLTPVDVVIDASNVTTGVLDKDRLPSTGVTPGIYGTSNSIPSLNIDVSGRVSNVVLQPISGLDASVISSGVLSSNLLPSTTVVAGTYGESNSVPSITFDEFGRATGVIQKTIPLAVKYLSDPSYTTLDATAIMLGSNIPKANTLLHATVNDQEYVAINAPAFHVTDKLYPDASLPNFGASIDLSGDGNVAVITAGYDDLNEDPLYVTHVYAFVAAKGNNWQLTTALDAKYSLYNGNRSFNYPFPIATNYDGTFIVLGMPRLNSGTGLIIMYGYDGTSVSYLGARGNPVGGAGYGETLEFAKGSNVNRYAVHLSGLAWENYNIQNYTLPGRVFIYNTAGTTLGSLVAPNSTNGNRFGHQMSMTDDGTQILISDVLGHSFLYQEDISGNWNLDYGFSNASAGAGFARCSRISGNGQTIVLSDTAHQNLYMYDRTYGWNQPYQVVNLPSTNGIGSTVNIRISTDGNIVLAHYPRGDYPSQAYKLVKEQGIWKIKATKDNFVVPDDLHGGELADPTNYVLRNRIATDQNASFILTSTNGKYNAKTSTNTGGVYLYEYSSIHQMSISKGLQIGKSQFLQTSNDLLIENTHNEGSIQFRTTSNNATFQGMQIKPDGTVQIGEGTLKQGNNDFLIKNTRNEGSIKIQTTSNSVQLDAVTVRADGTTEIKGDILLGSNLGSRISNSNTETKIFSETFTFHDTVNNKDVVSMGNAGGGVSAILVGGHIVPDTAELYDIGTADRPFHTLYLAGNTLSLGGTTIGSSMTSGLVTSKLTTSNLIATVGVGIGTTIPCAPLHVVGNVEVDGTLVASNLRIQGTTFTVDTSNLNEINTTHIDIVDDGCECRPALRVVEMGSNANVAEFYHHSNISALTINKNGNVGIGIDPKYPLHVSGEVRIEGNIFASNLAPSGYIDATDANNITKGVLSAQVLPTSGVVAGTYGSGFEIPVVTVDTKGRVTNVALNTLSFGQGGGTFADSAFTNTTNATNISTGTLSANRLPNTSVTPGTYGASNAIPIITVDATGRVQSVSTIATATNAGGATFTGTLDASNITSGTLSSNLLPLTNVSAGTYGSSTQIPVLTIDDTGRVRSVSSIALSGGTVALTGTLDASNITSGRLDYERLPAALDEKIDNIANGTYIRYANATAGTPSTQGVVGISASFQGNSSTYSYQLTVRSTTTSYTYTSPTRTVGASDSQSFTFGSGTYTVDINAWTAGTGYGARIQRSNVTSFTVGSVDTIGVPSVSLLSAPTIGGASYTYVSGIPYYGPGTTLSFASNTINFGNIYQTIDPRTVLTRVLRLTIGSTANDYSHNTIFTNVLTANNRNNTPLSLTISGGSVTSSLNLSGTVYNVNYQGGSTNSSLFTGIGYIGSAVSETGNVASFTGMPITQAVRKSLASNVANSNAPTSAEILSYTNTPSSMDAFYSPFGSAFYSSFASIPRGTYSPAFSAPAGVHNRLIIEVTTNAPLTSFVVNLTGATAINKLFIQWKDIGGWYDATQTYLSGGCAAATYTAGATRFPIRIPDGLDVSTPSVILLNIEFSGSIPLSGITISNT